MAQMDANFKDGKGWRCVKENGAVSTLKTFARKQGNNKTVYRIFEDGVCTLVGRFYESGMMRWVKGNGKPRCEMDFGTEAKPKRCKCGSQTKPIFYNENAHHYHIECASDACPAKSISTFSASAIERWNKL